MNKGLKLPSLPSCSSFFGSYIVLIGFELGCGGGSFYVLLPQIFFNPIYWDNDECGNYDACIHLPFTEREDKNK